MSILQRIFEWLFRSPSQEGIKEGLAKGLAIRQQIEGFKLSARKIDWEV